MLLLLGILIFVYNLGLGLQYASGFEPSLRVELLHNYGLLCGVVWWLRAERRKYQISPLYCDGLLVGFAWPFLVPYHLFKTRGVKGFIPLLGLIGSFVAAYVLAVLVYIATIDLPAE